MNPTALFIPGSSGNSQKNFYQLTGKALKDSGFEVYYIDTADKNPVKAESWIKQLQSLKDKFGPETYLISHSSGSFAASRFLTDEEVYLKAWHIVGSSFDENKINTDNQDFVITQAKNFKQDKEFDFRTISKKCERIVLHYDQTDPLVNFDEWREYKRELPKAILQKYKDKNHFLDEEFPELVSFILQQEKTSWTIQDGQKYRIHLLEENELPLVLPDVVDYLPSTDGKSPLRKTDWVKIKDHNDKFIGLYESDTMPNWAGSSWYYLRYTDSENSKEFASQENLNYWLPVDHYFGGNEHTTLHLLYSRFWHKFLYDQGYLKTSEPYKKRTNGGILLSPDGQKMSKSKGTIIKIKEKLNEFGADAVRMYVAFIGPYDATVIWNDGGLKACKKLIDTIWNLKDRVVQTEFLPKKYEENTDQKYLIFDFDGVLADTWNSHLNAYMELKSLDYQTAFSDIVEAIKKPITENIKSDKDSTEYSINISQKMLAHGASLFVGFLNEIKKITNAKLAIVSSGSREKLIQPLLEKAGLDFTHVLGIEDHVSKVEKIKRISIDWKIDPSQVYFFTDTESDIKELRNTISKSRLIGCSWGWHGRKILQSLLEEGQILYDFADIHPLLKTKQSFNFEEEFLNNLLSRAKDDRKTPSIHVVIRSIDNKIYVQHRRDDREVIPGLWEASVNGKVEEGESLLRAIQREVYEETGWTVSKINCYLGAYDWVQAQDGKISISGEGKKHRSFSFEVEVEGDLDTPNIEESKVDEFRWITRNEIDLFEPNEKAGDKNTKLKVKKVFESQPQIDKKLLTIYHKFIKNTTEQIRELRNNVAVAEIMSFVNQLKEYEQIPSFIWKGFLQVLAPFAPYISEELWYQVNGYNKEDYTKSIHLSAWPEFNPDLTIEDHVTIAIQVNGKLRGTIEIAKDTKDDTVLEQSKEKVKKWIDGKEIKFSKVIPNKIVSFVVK